MIDEQQAIRCALAKHLPGMREECVVATDPVLEGRWHVLKDGGEPHPVAGCHPEDFPVPTTAEGLTDVGRLIKAIEAEGYAVEYQTGYWYVAPTIYRGNQDFSHDPNLSVAFLKARRDWPLKEAPHA